MKGENHGKTCTTSYGCVGFHPDWLKRRASLINLIVYSVANTLLSSKLTQTKYRFAAR